MLVRVRKPLTFLQLILKPLWSAARWQGGGGTPRTHLCCLSRELRALADLVNISDAPISRPEPHPVLLNGNTLKHPLRVNSGPCSIWCQTPPLTTLPPMSGAVDYMKFLKALERVWIIGFEVPSALKKSHLQNCRSKRWRNISPWALLDCFYA